MNTYWKLPANPYFTTISLIPENQEAPVNFLPHGAVPDEYFFRRNHLHYPIITGQSFFLPLYGEVERPMVFSYMNLLSMPSKSMAAVLECSGNKRKKFQPRVYGEQWSEGAIHHGVWRGVPLRYLFDITGIRDTAVEVVFEGHDTGTREDMEGLFSFTRSLPVCEALHLDVLIAYELNDRPIPYRHGYPLRLIVPEWYGMASVKWLKRIVVIDHKFQGPFQTVDYVYYPHKHDDEGKRPVTTINVNSIIQQPVDYTKLDTGTHTVKGIAYTGKGVITRVEISFDGGQIWENAELNSPLSQPYSWTPWHYKWSVHQKGEYTIMVRVFDSAGRTQPIKAEWNRKGYGYNAVTEVHVKVE